MNFINHLRSESYWYFGLKKETLDSVQVEPPVVPVPTPNPLPTYQWNISNFRFSYLDCASYTQPITTTILFRSESCRLIQLLDSQLEKFPWPGSAPVVVPHTLPFLEHREHITRITGALLQGTSGCGKSVTLFGWIQLQTSHRRIWVHANIIESLFDIFVMDQSNSRCGSQSQMSFESVLSLIAYMGIDIVIFDGLTDEDYVVRLYESALKYKFFLVICTSGSTFLQPHISYADYKVYVEEAFSLSELAQADTFLRSADWTAAQREERYYITGGCPYTYFNFRSNEKLREVLIYYTLVVPDRNKIFSTVISPDSIPLFSYEESRVGRPLISFYAVQCIYPIANDEFLTEAYDASDNPHWTDIVVQLDIVSQMRHAWAGQNYFVIKKTESQRNVLKVLINTFVEYSSTFTEIPNVTHNNDTPLTGNCHKVVFVPRSHYSGFNAFVVEYSGTSTSPVATVSFIQCTVFDDHSYHMTPAAAVLSHLFPPSHGFTVVVRYVIVRPSNVWTSFNVPTAATPITDADLIQAFDPTFAFPASFRLGTFVCHR